MEPKRGQQNEKKIVRKLLTVKHFSSVRIFVQLLQYCTVVRDSKHGPACTPIRQIIEPILTPWLMSLDANDMGRARPGREFRK